MSGREDIHVNLTYGNRGNVSIPKVPGGTDRKYYIYAWILAALFANNYYYNNYQVPVYRYMLDYFVSFSFLIILVLP